MLKLYPNAYTYYPDTGMLRLNAQLLPFNINNHQPWTQESAEQYIEQTLAQQQESAGVEKPKLRLVSIIDTSDNSAAVITTGILNLMAGTQTAIEVAVLDVGDNVIPITKEFAVNIAGLLGSAPIIRTIKLIDGLGSLKITWTNEGRYQITESEINLDMAQDEQHFQFDPVLIKVAGLEE